MSIVINILLVIFVFVSLLMILVILMQRPKSEGLGAAFGGGVTENIFGAQTTNVLTKATSWLAGIFFLITFVLSMLYAHQTNKSSSLRNELMKGAGTAAVPPPSSVPAATAAVGAPGTVTNPTPAGGGPGVAPARPLTPADQAVGITEPIPAASAAAAPAGSVAPTAAPSASSQPSP